MSSMNDPRFLHHQAVKNKPAVPAKASTIWVAVLKADKLPTANLSEDDFLWVKCHGRITAQAIYDQYKQRFTPREKWMLRHESKQADLSATMAHFNTYNDNVIVFEAADTSDTSCMRSPRPLEPKNVQLRSQPTTTSKASGDIKPEFPIVRDRMTNISDENRDAQQPAPYSHSPRAGQAMHSGPSLPPKPQSDGSSCGGSLSPQVSGVSRPTRCTDAAVGPTGHKMSMDGFERYCTIFHDRPRMPYPSDDEVQIRGSLRKTWAQTPPFEGARCDAQAKPSLDDRGIKPEPKTENNHRDIPPRDKPALSVAELDEQRQKSLNLQTLLKDAGPDMLEKSVEQGVECLKKLKAPLLNEIEHSPDAGQWIQQIDKLIKQAVKTRTVIGVVGNTGAGKSSVINAMLDEERLVPTNCMRACTAVVTEISYNHENEPYRAEVEFISLADWEKELKTLFQDLLDGDGKVSRECANEDTDAGIAYAKIKAVYPRKTKEDLANSNIETMLREVSHVLGGSRNIGETDSLKFYKKLQRFVDSKEKSTGNKDRDKDKDKKNERKEMEFWPLIRVVRIYVKSRALATGAVIVDLPGVHDANAARAAVAEGYMKQCTGLWIVAPINRAVDDKAAKSLLGESFKRQLKMDGGFNSVTFICSKTDDISLVEAQDTLDLEDEMGPSWEEIDGLVKKQKSLKKQLEEMKVSKAVYGEVMNDVDEQIDVWDVLKDRQAEGEPVFPPKSKSYNKKRKSNSKTKARKKPRRSSSDDEDLDDSDSESDDSDGESNERAVSDDESQDRKPLCEEQIVAKLQELRATKKEARTQRAEITKKITAIRDDIGEAKQAEDKIESKMSALCISGRNQYSKGAIQQDFAAGIKELDQELAAEEDEENFNPDAEIRDYEEVARGLPVFCVSSRAYQKLQGRLERDPHIAGFTSIDQTEIPQLQAHCEKLTETGRSANCRIFINKLSQLLNSLTLWASSDGINANMTAEQKSREAKYLQKGLNTLECGLEKSVKTACKELGDELADNIYDKYETAISNAIDQSIETALKWGAPVNRVDRAAGGLHWSTYKAICRRNGNYANAQGPHQWNVQLAEPMMNIIASGWEKVFSRRSPMVMASFVRNSASCLKQFHRDIEARARSIGAGIAGLHMLQQQVGVYESLLKDLSITIKDTIDATQKEINREFVPVIEQAMQDAYETCVNERGPGSFARMKAAMNSHISHERHTMFQSSADNVQNLLNVMISDMENNMNDKADEIFVQMQRDYRAVLGGAGLPQGGELLTRSQRLVRKEIMRIIDGVEGALLRVAGLETQEDEDKDGAGNERHKEPGDDDCVEERKGEDTAVPNDEKSEEINVKEEASPSSQLSDHAEQRIELNPAIQSSLDGEMKDAPQLESDQDQDFDPRPEVDEDSFEPSESSAGFESN